MIWRILDRLFHRRSLAELTPIQRLFALSIKSRRGIWKERI